MHTVTNKRVADLNENVQKGLKLPPETHFIEGTLEADGSTSLASEKAKLSARVISLTRTASGGINYQLAIYADEPQTVAEEKAPEVSSDEKACIGYFTSKGYSEDEAKEHVKTFGVARVLAKIKAELDDKLETVVAGKKKD